MPPRYTPQLSAENIRRLYHLKQTTRRPMTTLLNGIVAAYFETATKALPQSDTNGRSTIRKENP